MFSAFESWMVTEYHKRNIQKAGMSLNSLFGVMSTLNSVMAILSGVFSEWLVQITDDRKMPFMASAALLGISAYIIAVYWVSTRFQKNPTSLANNIPFRPRTTAIAQSHLKNHLLTAPKHHPVPTPHLGRPKILLQLPQSSI